VRAALALSVTLGVYSHLQYTDPSHSQTVSICPSRHSKQLKSCRCHHRLAKSEKSAADYNLQIHQTGSSRAYDFGFEGPKKNKL
jgi:hypothetical protein